MQGIGTDLIEIERIRLAVKEERFLPRLFTQNELDYFATMKDPVPSIAGRFAAKEAVAKALGTGFGASLSWQDISIERAPSGKPSAILSEKAKNHFGNVTILISISHTHTYATAIAFIQ